MNRLILAAVLSAVLASGVQAQQSVGKRAQMTITLFRSPATGLAVETGRVGVHGGFYPTILRADREAKGRNVNFLRLGFTLHASTGRLSPYITPSFVFSLDNGWKHGALSEAGIRWQGGRWSVRAGGAVLTTLDGEVRLNPTIGLGLRFGGSS